MQKNTGNSNSVSISKTVLILGAGLMQCPAIFSARLLGYRVIVADGNKKAVGVSCADEFWHIDLRDVDALVVKAKSTYLDGVLTCATDFSYAVATIAQACNLSGIGVDTAKIANYKHIMRDCLYAAGIAVPKYLCITIEDSKGVTTSQIDAIALQIDRKFTGTSSLVIKPVDNMGARGVICVKEKSELPHAILYASSFSQSRKIIIEECLSGPELSIDSCIIDGVFYPLGIADRHVYFYPYFIETGHTIPSVLPKSLQIDACNELAKAAKVAGIQNGICKGDIIFHQQKAYIGEFAARLSGGYMSGWTIPYTEFSFMGNSPTEVALKQSLGIAISTPNPNKKTRKATSTKQAFRYLQKNVKNYVSERALLALPGKLQDIVIDKDFYNTSALRTFFINVEIGNMCVLPKCNPQKAGTIIVADTTRNAANRQASILLTKIYFKTEINEEANTFLFSRTLNDSPSQFWRCYPFNELELINREYLLSLVNSGQLFDKNTILKPLPVWVPKELYRSEILGSWTHTNIISLIELAQKKQIIVICDSKKHSSGGLFWSAILRGGWQGLQYLLQILLECPNLLKSL